MLTTAVETDLDQLLVARDGTAAAVKQLGQETSSRTRCVSPADWLRSRHLEGLPTLFIDRSLGRSKVPALLRGAGLELVTLAEHYGIPQDEEVDDVTWLADTAARGWVALGKDERIRRRPAEKAAVRRHGARCFYFTRGDLPAEIYVERILANLEAIARACTEAGPFIYVMHPNRIERMAL